jgi:glycosyltransferase involved in cell wall biosynthesis
MKVCLIGDVNGPLDEGMKKTAAFINHSLSKYCEVLVLSPADSLRPSFWVNLHRFHPEILHYIPGPSSYSFVLARMIKAISGAKTVISLTHPNKLYLHSVVYRICKPDLMIYQSEKYRILFNKFGCKTIKIPNGVGLETFRPVSTDDKKLLRIKYELPLDKQIVLHVGNTRAVRNLDVLCTLQSAGYQVLVVSSTTISRGDQVEERLISAGCIVWHRYIERIEEIYQLSDCYVFPTIEDAGAIQHPLSVMEAMACNLPVISRKFGALTNVFDPGNGLLFVESDQEVIEATKEVFSGRVSVKTRIMVEKLGWKSIGYRIFEEYTHLLCSGKSREALEK